MKHLLLLVIIIPVFCSAQVTTMREYKYMKAGFAADMELGRDIIDGYSIRELPSQKYGDVDIKAMMMLRKDSSLAGIILKTSSVAYAGSGTNFYCIPAVSNMDEESYGWKEFNNDVNLMTGGQKSAVIGWMSYQYQYILSQLRRCNLNLKKYNHTN